MEEKIFLIKIKTSRGGGSKQYGFSISKHMFLSILMQRWIDSHQQETEKFPGGWLNLGPPDHERNIMEGKINGKR